MYDVSAKLRTPRCPVSSVDDFVGSLHFCRLDFDTGPDFRVSFSRLRKIAQTSAEPRSSRPRRSRLPRLLGNGEKARHRTQPCRWLPSAQSRCRVRSVPLLAILTGRSSADFHVAHMVLMTEAERLRESNVVDAPRLPARLPCRCGREAIRSGGCSSWGKENRQ